MGVGPRGVRAIAFAHTGDTSSSEYATLPSTDVGLLVEVDRVSGLVAREARHVAVACEPAVARQLRVGRCARLRCGRIPQQAASSAVAVCVASEHGKLALEPRAVSANAARHAIEKPWAPRALCCQLAREALFVASVVTGTPHALPWPRNELFPHAVLVPVTIPMSPAPKRAILAQTRKEVTCTHSEGTVRCECLGCVGMSRKFAHRKYR